MYTVVEYTNYRKEVDISVHGYFDNCENALKFSKEKHARQCHMIKKII